jgi:hypothetical protein
MMKRVKLLGGPCDGLSFADAYGDELRMVETFGGGYSPWRDAAGPPMIYHEIYLRSVRSSDKFVWQP